MVTFAPHLLPLGVVALVLASCGPPSILFEFENRTTNTLCDYEHPAQVEEGLCLAVIKPLGITKWGRDCDNDNGRPIRLIIALRDTKDTIYDRTASCGDWDGNGQIVIEERDGDFVVTDELGP